MSQPTRILISLIAGLVAGIAVAGWSAAYAGSAIAVAQPIGTAWLNALQMTIVPLVVALLVTGVAATAEAVSAGRVAAVSIGFFVITLFVTAVLGAILTPVLLAVAPLPAESAAALRAALAEVAPAGAVPSIGEFLASIVPTNAVRAAADDAFLSLIIFTLVFAFAVTRVGADRRQMMLTFFEALRDVMLVVIDWVLWLAPLGVFALALVVGAKAGGAAFGALIHYVLIVSSVGVVIWVLGYVLGPAGGGIAPLRFIRGTLPSQAVAISTQSSLASLPAMIEGAEAMAVPRPVAAVALPLAVALFRATGPAMNIAVAIYVAKWFGVALTPGTLAAATVVATLTSLGSVSLPGQISFISSIAPIAATLGAPVAPLGLLVAVETIPDIFRTVGNVTMDLAATATIAARVRNKTQEPE